MSSLFLTPMTSAKVKNNTATARRVKPTLKKKAQTPHGWNQAQCLDVSHIHCSYLQPQKSYRGLEVLLQRNTTRAVLAEGISRSAGVFQSSYEQNLVKWLVNKTIWTKTPNNSPLYHTKGHTAKKRPLVQHRDLGRHACSPYKPA